MKDEPIGVHMENNKILEYCKKLEGISYWDWVKVLNTIDMYFGIKISQRKDELKLTEMELLSQAYKNI